MVYTVKREGGLHAYVLEKGDACVALTMKTGTAKGGNEGRYREGWGPWAGTTNTGGPQVRTARFWFFRACARVSSVQICIFIHGEITVPKWLSMDWREPFLEGQRQDPETSGKWRQWPSSAIGPGRQGRVSAGPDGRLVIPWASRARAITAKICIFIHGEMPLPKGPSKDWREPFLEALASGYPATLRKMAPAAIERDVG